eukprot:ANDGO_00123.mRNA.1 hypothetical protein GUITHDRAFT_85007
MAKSWGEDVENYRKAKLELPFVPEPVFRKTRDKSMLWRTQPYDPVIQTLRDPSEEERRRTVERARSIQLISSGIEKSMRYGAQYDIISNSEKRPATVGTTSLPNAFGSSAKKENEVRYRSTASVDYNIISGVPLTEAYVSSPETRPNFATLLMKPRPTTHGNGKRTFHVEAPTDFNILSNLYKVNHDTKTREDEEKIKQELEQKYWATHDFDPLLQKYHMQGKDEAVDRAELERTSMLITAKMKREPPTMREAEGNAYDITSFSVRDAELFDKVMSRTSKGVAAVQKMRETMEIKREEANQKYNKDLQRAFNRTATRTERLRDYEELARGYDIVSNVDFGGVDGRAPDYVQRAEDHAAALAKPDPFDVHGTQKMSRTWDGFLRDKVNTMTSPVQLPALTLNSGVTNAAMKKSVRSGGFHRE